MAPIQALIDKYDEVMEQMGEEMTEGAGKAQ